MDPSAGAALLAALFGAIIGVIGTYIFDIRKAQVERRERQADQERERGRHRQTVATALMQDLRQLEFALREILHSSEPTKLAVARPALLFDSLRAEIRWFSPGSIEPLVEFHRRCDHIYKMYQTLRLYNKGVIQPTPQRRYECQAHAAFALQFLPRAVAALRNEGAVVPAPVDWATETFPDLPPVPPPVFDDAIARFEQRALDAR